MNANQLRDKYLEFFKSKGHVIIPSASLVPKDDPSVLFNTAGMQPLVPYLSGQPHPLGKRLVNIQKCLRTVDFENIGDNTHHTFFQMLGNWSLGDYFKKEAISWSFEFLTGKKWLNIPLKMLAFTVYEGDKTVPRDTESYELWKSLGVPAERIAFLGKDNFWIAGETGPCGPSTEMFYWTGDGEAPKKFDPKDQRWVEIWNDVFMEYLKDKRLILADGMHCLYDENFKLNKELLEIINRLNTHNILVVNGFREKGVNLIKSGDQTKDTNWKAFSLEEESIKKDNPKYFKELMRRFKLVPEELIYFDHDKKNVETAKGLGILAKHYTDTNSIKKFIEDNTHAFIPLSQKNVDTGMGLERTLAVLNGKKSAYETDLFQPIIKKMEQLSGKKYKDHQREMRIVADHLRSATFILGDENGVIPSNVDRGYVLRRLIRRAVRYAKLIGMNESLKALAEMVVKEYGDYYAELRQNKERVFTELLKEEQKFAQTLEKGLKEFEKMASQGDISGKGAFLLFQSYGFPLEMTEELADEKKVKVDVEGFLAEFQKHQELSRKGAEQKFKGGLADLSAETVRLHTATHLLNEALRKVIDPKIKQRGSNITPERLRFDFSFDRKLTREEIKKVEDEVNKVIKKQLPVACKEMTKEQAVKIGSEMEFGQKYPDKVTVYFIGDYSKEFCGGPHVKNTKEVGKFKIIKEEACSAGVRRIKAVVE